MRRNLLYAGSIAAAAAMLLCFAPVRAADGDQAVPHYGYGTFAELGTTAVSIALRPQNTTLALTLNAETRLGIAAYGKLADVVKDATVAVVVAPADPLAAKGIAFCKPDVPKYAEDLVGAVAWRLNFIANRGNVPDGGPKPIVGKVTATADGSMTLQVKDKAVTVTTAGQVTVIGVVGADNTTAFTKGKRAMALYGDDTKVAKAVLQMPEPQTRG